MVRKKEDADQQGLPGIAPEKNKKIHLAGEAAIEIEEEEDAGIDWI